MKGIGDRVRKMGIVYLTCWHQAGIGPEQKWGRKLALFEPDLEIILAFLGT